MSPYGNQTGYSGPKTPTTPTYKAPTPPTYTVPAAPTTPTYKAPTTPTSPYKAPPNPQLAAGYKPVGGSNIYGTTQYTSSLPKPQPQTLNTSPKPFGQTGPVFDYSSHYGTVGTKEGFKSVSKPYDEGVKKSEFSTNTYKTPEGYRTDTFRYESYESAPQPIVSYSSEKYYTGAPGGQKGFDTFRNGSTSEFQTSSFSTNSEIINEPPVLKDTDSLEQKMLKKSVTQQITEKKVVSMTRSSRQESSSKTFKLE